MSARAVQEFVASIDSDPDCDYTISQHASVIDFINQLYAAVERHQDGFVIVHLPTGYVFSVDDFQNVFSACNFKVRFPDHILHDENVGSRWLRHPNRRQVETVEELEHDF